MNQRYNNNTTTKAARYSAGDLKNLCIMPYNSAEGLGSKRERCWDFASVYENTPKKLLHLPPKAVFSI